MDRYQFEDLISDYLEGDLNLPKRREFEAYLSANPDCRVQVESMRNLLVTMHGLTPVRTSPDFMVQLLRRVEAEKQRKVFSVFPDKSGPRTLWGFTPVYAGLMAVVFVALIVVTSQLIPDRAGVPLPPGNVADQISNEYQQPMTVENVAGDLATNEVPAEDSTEALKTLPERDQDYQDRLLLVKDQK
ncbi:MAG: hypothetical protein ABIA75_00115 [Candidatus Neomarinimicrobiota bacterium]